MTKSNNKENQGIAIEESLPKKQITVYGMRLLPLLIVFMVMILLINLFLHFIQSSVLVAQFKNMLKGYEKQGALNEEEVGYFSQRYCRRSP